MHKLPRKPKPPSKLPAKPKAKRVAKPPPRFAVPATPTGRPSSYRPEFAEQAAKLCTLGATDIELADFFKVERTTIWRWSQVHAEFCNALKVGKDAADERVQRSLFAKAIGYTHDAVKVLQHDGAPVIVPYREHVAPDTTAAIFWLKNRRPKEWRDKQDQDLGTAPNPIVVLLQQMRARALPVVLVVDGPATEIEDET
ncbi:hypothetical protein [Falsiroseomonas sp. E2-1-a20]|uniref:hypothetical protein n=1 Tax=Falsiroseomonas sp. E2-1-a20 TaxID=3239300 RepID=UPI003F2EAF93